MCCRGQALTPWGAGLGAQLQRAPHRDPWVRGRREPPWFSRLNHWECSGCFPHRHHTSACERKLAKWETKKKKDSEKGDGGCVGGGARSGVEHRGRTRSNNRHCGITATLHLCQSQCLLCRGKKKGGKNRKRTLGVPLCSRFTFQKKSGAIISIQMTALCRCIPD